MDRKRKLAAILGSALLLIVAAPGAGAYTRNVVPVATLVTCAPLGPGITTINVFWDKNAGKPDLAVLSWTQQSGSGGATQSIAGKWGSKGYVFYSFPYDLLTVTAQVKNSTGSSNTVGPVNCT